MLKQLVYALRHSWVVGKTSEHAIHPLHASGEPVISESKCRKCKHCARVCPTGAWRVQGFPESWLIFHAEKCISCARCVETCPDKALTFKPAVRGYHLFPYPPDGEKIKIIGKVAEDET